MKKLLLLLILICNISIAYSQTSPYSASPKWMFGYYGGIDFTSGSPVLTNVNPLKSEEMSSAMCEPNKNIVVYSNNYRVVGNNNVPIATLLTGSTSSTNGPVIIPDPAAPTTQWYLFTGNAEVNNSLGGGTAQGGINAYLIVKSGATVTATFVSQLATGSEVREQLYASADGTGGYWVLSRQNVTNGTVGKYNSWHVTTGGIGAKVTSNGTFTPSWSTPWQGSVKISKCQTRVAYAGNNVEVHAWNKTTGQAGALLAQTSTGVGAYGCEFSPDGNFLYYTSYSGNQVYQLNISSGVVTALGTATITGSMQLGPDGRIYMATGWHDTRPAFLGVINNPNVAGVGCGYSASGFALGTTCCTSPSVFRGIANQAWINPNLPVISSVVGGNCKEYNFSYLFQTYFLDNITVVAGSEVWNFGDGTGDLTGLGATPSHTFATDGTYTVRVTVTDATCNQTWTNTTSVSVNCPMPVELINFSGIKYDDKVKLFWSTSSEKNNDHFTIERSNDGINFTSIGVVKGNGNSNTLTNWSFYDNSPLAGIGYYRLAQYDFDGQLTYSNIISIEFNSDLNVLVYPNPFNNEINVQVLSETPITIYVYDVLGRKVKEIVSVEDIITFGSDLNSGCYVLGIHNGNKYYTVKVIKK